MKASHERSSREPDGRAERGAGLRARREDWGRGSPCRGADVDVAAIRASTGLSQSAFARSIGVAKGTLRNWEQGRRRPTGPAQVLLAMIARKPSLVSELLR